jgi:hypothetical protein
VTTLPKAIELAAKGWPGARVYVQPSQDGFLVTLDLFHAPSYGRGPSAIHSGTYLTREMAEAQSFGFVLQVIGAMLKDAEERAKRAQEEVEHLRGL